MTDREALYRAVLAHPADDAPRLVYADWLQENGRDEEAEFIRVGCRVDTLPPDHPDHAELLARRRELELWLTAHAPVPAPQLAAGLQLAAADQWWTSSRRGFPRFFEFDGHATVGLKPIRELCRALERAIANLPTRWLVVRFVTPEQLAELLKHPVVAALDRLTVQREEAQTPQDAARIIAGAANLRNLRGLSLAFAIGAEGATALARSEHLGNLEWLALDARNPAAIRHLSSGPWFRNLRELWLHDTVSDEAFQELCRSATCPELHTLDLRRARLGLTSWEAFARSRAFPRLARLAVGDATYGGSYMGAGRIAALAGSPWFRLASLDLSFCSIHEDGVAALLNAPWVDSLRWLSLRGNTLWPGPTAAIARCRKFANLRHLDLSDNWIGLSGFKAIAKNPALRELRTLLLAGRPWENRNLAPATFATFLTDLKLPHLRHLSLSGRPLGGKSAKLLANDKFESLTRLELSGCKLTDAAVATLLTAPAIQNLIELDLSGNKLDVGLEPLTDPGTLPRLSRCNLHGNRISSAREKKLARRQVVWTSP